MRSCLVLLAYASLAASRNLLQQSLVSLNFTLDSEDLLHWYNRKKWFLLAMAAAQAAESWVRFDLILTMRDIYINSNLNPLTEFTSSSRSIEFRDILPWNISQIIIGYAIKQGILLCVWKTKSQWKLRHFSMGDLEEKMFETFKKKWYIGI